MVNGGFLEVVTVGLLALLAGDPGDAVGERQRPAATSAAIEAEPSSDAEALPVSVEIRNEMGRNFRLVEAHLMLDGVEVARKTAAPGGELDTSFRAFNGVVVGPGPHALNTVLVYEGRNRGPITYLENYRFRVSRDFTFGNGDAVPSAVIEVVAREREGVGVPLEQRPTLVVQMAPSARQSPAPVTNPPPATAVPVSTPPRIPAPR